MSEISIIDRQDTLRDNGLMAKLPTNASLFEALMALKPDELTPNGWAVKAGLNRNVFNDIRKNGRAAHNTIQKLLDAAGSSLAEFEALTRPDEDRAPSGSRVHENPFRAFREDRPKDVPVLGTPSCGEYVVRVEGEDRHIETIDIDLDETVDFVRRPPALDGRKDVYAIYPQGFSMVPKFEPGDVAYVDTRKPPMNGDYVVVQLRREDEDGERIVSALLKRLVRQTPEFVELQQFEPNLTFRIERRRVARIHRLYTLTELVAF